MTGTWPGGVIPYTLAPALPGGAAVRAAIARWNAADAGVRLVPYDGQPDHVVIRAGRGYASPTGRTGGRQDLTVPPDCRPGVVLHELGHTAGLTHEHNRPDRDDHVRVHPENIVPTALGHFAREPGDATGLGPYDFGSVMHYSCTAFSRNRGWTIVPRAARVPEGVLIGQRRHLSPGDVDRLHRLYAVATGAPTR